MTQQGHLDNLNLAELGQLPATQPDIPVLSLWSARRPLIKVQVQALWHRAPVLQGLLRKWSEDLGADPEVNPKLQSLFSVHGSRPSVLRNPID